MLRGWSTAHVLSDLIGFMGGRRRTWRRGLDGDGLRQRDRTSRLRSIISLQSVLRRTRMEEAGVATGMKEEVEVHVYVPEELETMWRKERTMGVGVLFVCTCVRVGGGRRSTRAGSRRRTKST